MTRIRVIKGVVATTGGGVVDRGEHNTASGFGVSGNDGDTDRTLVKTVDMQVTVDGIVLNLGFDYLYDEGSTTITFVNQLFDDQIIGIW